MNLVPSAPAADVWLNPAFPSVCFLHPNTAVLPLHQQTGGKRLRAAHERGRATGAVAASKMLGFYRSKQGAGVLHEGVRFVASEGADGG